MSEEPVYIFGHKNPDTDSICAALAYADYKHQKGQTYYTAARCGNSNSRIDAVLNRFGVELPVFIGDVTPRVRDLMKTDIFKTQSDATCAEALDIIEDNDIRSMPVVDKDQKLKGMVTIFDLGAFFIPKMKDKTEIRHVRTTIQSIQDSLGAKPVHVIEPEQLQSFYVRVGAMDIRSFGRFVDEEGTKAEESAIIVGDRWDIQQKAIQIGVRLLIITGEQKVDETVISMAKERGVSIIVSPHDSATTSWLTRTATRLEPMIQNEVITFDPDDTINFVRRKITNNYAPIYMVVDEDNRLLGMFTNSDILKPVKTRIALVDHNELSQAVNGAEQVNILEILDHHRLGNPPTHQPILFHNIPVGSTCTIIAKLYKADGLKPSPSMAGIMMSGIISDTLKLKSPTSTPTDEEILKWLESIADISIDDLAELIFTSGSVILNTSPDKVITTDCKKYEQADKNFSVSQVEELGFENFWERWGDIQKALDNHREQEELYFSCLLVTDIRSQNSLLLVSGSKDLIDAIKHPHVEHDTIFDMPNIVSRKKQLIPYLTDIIDSIPSA